MTLLFLLTRCLFTFRQGKFPKKLKVSRYCFSDIMEMNEPGENSNTVPSSYEGSEISPEEKEDSPPAEIVSPEDSKEDEWLDVLGSGDLKVKTIKKGQPDTRPQNFEVCTIKYSVSLEDGSFVDSSDSFKIEVNGSEVIQGLDLVLSLLEVGQIVEAIIKPRFAYGALGLKPNIPPNATLVYHIELLHVDIPSELTEVTFDERITRALYKKERGNWWYTRGDGNKAVQCYRAAIDLLQESTPYTDASGATIEMPEETFREMVKHRLIVYNNLAAAQLLIDAFESALLSVDNVLKLEPTNIKALFRKGKILTAKGNTEEAIDVYSKVCALEPDNVVARKELNLALKKKANENMQAKSLYKKMLGTDENRHGKKQGNRGSSSISLWTKILGVTASATLAVAVAYGMGFKYKSLTFW